MGRLRGDHCASEMALLAAANSLSEVVKSLPPDKVQANCKRLWSAAAGL